MFNYEIHIKTELKDTILSYDFDEEYFCALDEDIENGGILQNLYDDFISDEYASVNTGEDAICFIRNYCEKYHSFAMNEYLDKTNTVYFGKYKEDTAYYYFKDSFAIDDLARIKEPADE